MPVTVILGEQRGDEGKGRFVDMLAEDHDVVARFNGGANAGHTVVLPESDGRELALHLLPSGIAHDHTANVIGNGTVIDPVKLDKEINDAHALGIEIDESRLLISSAAHLILPHHISLDEIREAGAGSQGSTKCGIAPAYADKAMRAGIQAASIRNHEQSLVDAVTYGIIETNTMRRAHDLSPLDPLRELDTFMQSAERIGAFVTDTAIYLHNRLKQGARVLAEGAQAFLLDVDHGMYPATTSSSTTVGGVATGLGIDPRKIDQVIGVIKAVPSHVGGGPFTTEIHDEALLKQLHGKLDQVDSEVGTTTGRVRRLGYLDLAAIKRAHMVNGTDEIALTKLDWVPRFGEVVRICTSYVRKSNEIQIAPDAAYKIEESEPQYIELSTWQEDISEVRQFKGLPKEAQAYIECIEEETDKQVTMIGVGPRRDQVIVRK